MKMIYLIYVTLFVTRFFCDSNLTKYIPDEKLLKSSDNEYEPGKNS